MSTSTVKRITEFVDGRRVEYISWKNRVGTVSREYCAKKTTKCDPITGNTVSFFDVELPAGSIKNATYIGRFDNYRELEAYHAKMIGEGFEKNMVAQIEGENSRRYVLLLGKELGGRSMYYIFVR